MYHIAVIAANPLAGTNKVGYVVENNISNKSANE